jgi:hypothetical protein
MHDLGQAFGNLVSRWGHVLARGAGTLHRAGMPHTAFLSSFRFGTHRSSMLYHGASAEGM